MNRLSQTGLFGALLTLSLACGPGNPTDPDGGDINPDGSVIVPDGGDTDGGEPELQFSARSLTLLTEKPKTEADVAWGTSGDDDDYLNFDFEVHCWNPNTGMEWKVNVGPKLEYTARNLTPNTNGYNMQVTPILRANAKRGIASNVLVFKTDAEVIITPDPEWEKIKNVIHGKPWMGIVPPDGNVSAQGTITLGEDAACTSGKVIKFAQNESGYCFDTVNFSFNKTTTQGIEVNGQITFCKNCTSYTGDDLAVCLAHPHVERCTPHWTTELEIDNKFVVIKSSTFNGSTGQSTYFSY